MKKNYNKTTMKKKLLFLAFGILFLSSCKKETNTTTTEVSPPNPTGTIEGFVALHDEFGNTLQSFAGVTVTLDSTSYSATTDSTGRYVLKNIPSNVSYNFTFNKKGFSSYHYKNFQFTVSGGSAPVSSINLSTNSNSTTNVVDLYQPSTTSVKTLTAGVYPGYIYLTDTITNSNPVYNQSTEGIGFAVFISTQKNVSSTNYQYSGTTTPSSSTLGVITYTLQPASYNYPIGATLYFAVYGYSSVGGNINPYYNTTQYSTASAVTQ